MQPGLIRTPEARCHLQGDLDERQPQQRCHSCLMVNGTPAAPFAHPQNVQFSDTEPKTCGAICALNSFVRYTRA